MAGKILCLTLLVSVAWVVMAADEDGCYIPEIKKVVPIGAVITPIGRCIRIRCEGKGFLSALTCPDEASIDPHCIKTELDLSLPYPNCCPKFKCD